MWLRTQRRNNSETDGVLLQKYRESRDMEALGILYDRYLDMVFGVCLKYFKDSTESEDATMAIFEHIVQKLLTHEVNNFKSWLYVVTKNYCLQALRKRAAPPEKALTELYAGDVMHSLQMEHPDDSAIFQNPENGLMDCLNKLPARQRKTIELFYFESRSYREIAGILSVNRDKVRSYMQNGRRNLRNCMEKKHGERKEIS